MKNKILILLSFFLLLFVCPLLAQKKKDGYLNNPNLKGKLKKHSKEFLPPKMILVNGCFSPVPLFRFQQVTIGIFYISEKEITNQQFCVFLNSYSLQSDTLTNWFDFSSVQNPFNKETDGLLKVKEGLEDEPVTNVSWLGATAYNKWLSEKMNGIREEYGMPALPNYRLPSEAEWEYIAWLQDQKEDADLEPVSKNKKAIKAVQGMMNSTLEWTEDVYVQNPFEFNGLGFRESIRYLEEDSEEIWVHVVRGGFVNSATAMKIDYTTRDQLPENKFSPNVGFRVVMTYLGRSSSYEF